MYQINILKNNNWEYFAECYDKNELDIIVQRLTSLRPNKAIQILEDEKLLVCLNGTEYQYFYFKKRYIENKDLEFNFIKEILVWATITEDVKNDQYRISIRSRGPEINKVAELYNGGGHKFASGVRIKTLEEALDVMNELDKELIKYNSIMDAEVI